MSSEAIDLDMSVRRSVYARTIADQSVPTSGDIADDLRLSADEVRASFERLAAGRMLVLERDTREIRMAMPFSAVKTDYVVTSGGRRWWANCAWDALAIGVVLDADIRIATCCGDCGEVLELDVTDGRLSTQDWVVHYAVPAAHWWDDVIFT